MRCSGVNPVEYCGGRPLVLKPLIKSVELAWSDPDHRSKDDDEAADGSEDGPKKTLVDVL